MLTFFRSNHLSVLGFLFVYALLIKFNQFIYPLPLADQYSAPFSKLVFGTLAVISPEGTLLPNILAFLLIYYQALVLNQTVNTYKMTSRRTYLPAMTYILVTSLFEQFTVLSPVLIGNTFIIASLQLTFAIYKKDTAYREVFDIGLYLAIGSLFYLPVFYFILLFMIGLVIIRPFYGREWIIGLSGLLTPYFLVSVWYFWHHEWYAFVVEHFLWGLQRTTGTITFDQAFFVKTGILGLVFLFAILHVQLRFFKNIVQVRKNMILLFWFLFLGMLLYFFSLNSGLSYFVMVSIPISMIISFYFAEIKKSIFAEILHGLLLLTIIYYQYSIFI